MSLSGRELGGTEGPANSRAVEPRGDSSGLPALLFLATNPPYLNTTVLDAETFSTPKLLSTTTRMAQQTLDGENISALRQQYVHTVTEALPAAAREAGDWPIDTDHCFGRVVLDNLFEDEWTAHVDGTPAYQNLSAAELRSAIEIADRLLAGGRPTVTTLNENSLRWRGELE